MANASGGLTKVGSGVLILSGANNYQGATNVNAGTLAVNGSLWGSGVVNVNNGGALSGSGGVGNLYVNSGGTLAPGLVAGAGTLNATTLTLYSGGVLSYTLGAGAGGNGCLNVSQSLTMPASGVTLNLFGVSGTGTYALGQYGSLGAGGASSGVFTPGNVPGSLAGDNFDFIASGNVLDLVIAAASGQVNGVWKVGSGLWSNSASWSGGNVPGANAQDTAVFGTVSTSGTATVTLDGSKSLSGLGFNNAGGASCVIDASNGAALTLANSGGLPTTISNSGGSHTINAPIVLGSRLNVTAAPGSALTIAGSLSESNPGATLGVSGGGTLILSGTDSYTGGTTVGGGTLAVTAAGACPAAG